MTAYVQSVPNFSEGRRNEIIDEILGKVRNVTGVKVLGVFPDHDFNRTVVELIGRPSKLKESLIEMAGTCYRLIDMEQQKGSHPRIGALDTIPLFPLKEISLEEVKGLAEEIGKEIFRRYKVPVFFSGANARSPERQNLDFIRRGQYEGLKGILFSESPDLRRVPDLGARDNFVGSGATIVSAGMKPLVAVNFILNTNRLDIAKEIARAARGPSGGFSTVRSVGLKFVERNQVAVSMNMFDYESTPLYRTFNFVQSEASRWGVHVVSTQLVGALSQEVLIRVAEYFLRLEGFNRGQILENHLLDLI